MRLRSLPTAMIVGLAFIASALGIAGLITFIRATSGGASAGGGCETGPVPGGDRGGWWVFGRTARCSCPEGATYLPPNSGDWVERRLHAAYYGGGSGADCVCTGRLQCRPWYVPLPPPSPPPSPPARSSASGDGSEDWGPVRHARGKGSVLIPAFDTSWFVRFLKARNRRDIIGAATSNSMWLTLRLAHFQSEVLRVAGHIGEIGVDHGLFFIWLSHLIKRESAQMLPTPEHYRPASISAQQNRASAAPAPPPASPAPPPRDDRTEHLLAMDLFEAQHLLQDNSGTGAAAGYFWEQAERWGVPRAAVTRLGGLSTDVTDEHIMRAGLIGGAGGGGGLSGFRIFHIDGGHLAATAVHDMNLAACITVDGGLVIVDDAMRLDWPGVQDGISRFMSFPPRTARTPPHSHPHFASADERKTTLRTPHAPLSLSAHALSSMSVNATDTDDDGGDSDAAASAANDAATELRYPLVPVAFAGGKLFLTTPAYHKRYVRFLLTDRYFRSLSDIETRQPQRYYVIDARGKRREWLLFKDTLSNEAVVERVADWFGLNATAIP